MDREEVSFSSMVQSNIPIPRSGSSAGRRKQLSAGPSFEFRPSSTLPVAYPADCMLSADSKIVPPQNGVNGHRQCLRQGNGRRSADSVPKRVSFQEVERVAKRSASSPLPERRHVTVGAMLELNPKKDAEKRKGLFGSIILACRDCHAVEPSKRVGVGSVAN